MAAMSPERTSAPRRPDGCFGLKADVGKVRSGSTPPASNAAGLRRRFSSMELKIWMIAPNTAKSCAVGCENPIRASGGSPLSQVFRRSKSGAE